MARPFSQRYGHVKVEDILQVEGINENTRTALWSCLYSEILTKKYFDNVAEKIMSSFWCGFLYLPADEEPLFQYPSSSYKGLKEYMKDFFRLAEWHEVLDFFEYVIGVAPFLSEPYNNIFKRMCLGYTIIDGLITPIVSPEEVGSIDNALNNGTNASKSHFNRALFLLSNREQPDFRNSIKESISAIESLCKKISGNEKGTLGDCLKTIEDKGHIHPAMKRAFQQLYGYTSDQGGIRHALTDDSEEPTLEEARYMLVICSAFSNYLVSKIAD